MFFLNQEINLATTSNPEKKSVNIKEHEHQTNKEKRKKKKEKHEHHQIKEHQQEQTQLKKTHTKPHPNHPKNRNPAKHPAHPFPNQTIIKEISNTTTS